MKTTLCSSCMAEIFFAVNEKTGRTIPLDAKASTIYEVADEDGGRVTVAGQRGHRSHFETCPNAKQHSKRSMR